MAQYFHVLSQGEKGPPDGMRKFYRTNVVENPSIQYVITPENQPQALQGQQIVVSTDQLMLIENQGQQVIVDQTGNAFQNAQYIIQEGIPTYSNIGSQPHRQVYYTSNESDNDQSAKVEQQVHQVSPPIVLNHQLQQTRTQVSSTATTTQKNVLATPARPMQQSRTAAPALTSTSVKQNLLQQQKMLINRAVLNSPTLNLNASTSTVAQRTNEIPTPPLSFPQSEVQNQDEKSSDGGDPICLPDGSIMPLANYKVMFANNKKPSNSTAVSSTSVIDEINTPSTSMYGKTQTDLPKPRVVRGVAVAARGGRARRGNGRQQITHSNLAFSTSQQESVELKNQAHQRFVAQQLKLVQQQQQQQQKANLPSTQFMQQRQHSQQAALRQQQLQKQQQLQQQQLQQQQQMQQQQQQSQQQHQLQQQQQQLQQQQQQQLQQQQQQQLQQQQQQQLQQQQQQQLQQQQYVQPQYIIQPPSMHQTPQNTLPPYIVSSQIQEIIESTQVTDEFPDSIRMLVLLVSGEQRLITFTLPKEVCTIQEILEQVGVPFQSDTRIECHETSYPGINYLVTVGFHPEQYPIQEEAGVDIATPQAIEAPPSTSDAVPSSPELLSEPETPPHYVSGLVAICTHCGYSSENLNKCLRCKYKFPNEIKTNPALQSASEDGDNLKDRKIAINLKTPILEAVKIGNTTIKKKVKKPEPELDVFTLSSDDDEEHNETDQLLRRFNNSSVTLSAIKKEPTITDLQQSMILDKQYAIAVKGGGKEDYLEDGTVIASIKCRTIRIGSFKYTPRFDFIIKPLEVILKVPSVVDPSDIKTIVIEKKNVAKVLVNFQKALPVLFYYVIPSLGETIRSELGMERGSDIYFDPVSSEEAYKRITILPEVVTEEAKLALKEIYGKAPNIVMDELTTKEANDILVKTCPKEISKFVEATMGTRCFSPEVRQLLIFPPGKGGLPINTEDYMCLAQDQFLNDVIIDFYLKYLVLQLPEEEQIKIHVFSTFFYKRLTTKPVKASRRVHPAELDPNLTPAQRRHARVEKWTKNVNLFDKDYVIVPINENCHWYLAIICFPALDGCYTMDGRHVQIEQRHRVHKALTVGSGAVTITNIKREKEKPIVCDDEDDISDKDEAEGDESELDSDLSDESDNPDTVQLEKTNCDIPIKQPCILIFDSLAGASRARVVATLRDYLTCEYKAKLGLEKVFNKDVIKGNCPKVPQQTNFTDCGLYLLQYVEHFLTHPIQNYDIPIKHLKHWFDEHTVTKKREDIAILIKDLMIQYNIDTSCVPVLTLPTLNGKLVDNFEDDEEELMNEYEDEEDEDEEDETCGEDASNEYLNSSMETHGDMEVHSDLENSFESPSSKINLNEEMLTEITLIPKQSNSAKRGGEFLEETVANDSELKPAVSELQNQDNRDTLSYLKTKRIIRHKNSSDLIDPKKLKTSYD